MKIPFVDLKAQYYDVKEEVNSAIQNVLEATAFSSGKFVEEFETDFAKFCNAKYAVGVNSGTSALHLGLQALGIGKGDEVITTPHTFISTVWAITYVGAKPVFVDIEPDYYTINPELIEKAITPKTKAIIPVHLYGHPADMSAIMEIAHKHGLKVIEDSAQAHGAMYNEQLCGSMGDVACFSFYPSKNLGAFGEAGAVTTNDADIALKIKQLRNHAQPERYLHNELGYNYRMDGIQGAVLKVNLSKINHWNNLRIKAADIYNENLKSISQVQTPKCNSNSKHIYHLYEIKLENKSIHDSLMQFLLSNDISCGLHYPVPVHLQEAYADLNYKVGDFPETENAADCLLSLPMFPHITQEMIEYIAENIKKFFNK